VSLTSRVKTLQGKANLPGQSVSNVPHPVMTISITRR
jgi:hypothetical protein